METTVSAASCRSDSSAAYDGVITALEDQASEVRQAAANALGLARHRNAVEPLLKRVASDQQLENSSAELDACHRIRNDGGATGE